MADTAEAIKQIANNLSKQISDLRDQVSDHASTLKELDKESDGGSTLKSIKTSISALEKRVAELEKKVKK